MREEQKYLEDLKKELTPIQKTVIVCLGNEFRGDDGIGPYVAKNIKNNKFIVIDAGQILESYIQDIIDYKPKKLIIIDAAFFDGYIGEIRVVDERKISNYKMISTHSFPLTILLDIIRTDLKDIDIKIIGIQISNTDYKEGLTEEVKRSANLLIDLINTL